MAQFCSCGSLVIEGKCTNKKCAHSHTPKFNLGMMINKPSNVILTKEEEAQVEEYATSCGITTEHALKILIITKAIVKGDVSL